MSADGTQEFDLHEVVQKVAPGTLLRAALDRIISAGTGALIVIEDNQSISIGQLI